MLRPNMKKQEDLKQMQSNIKKGDRVITIGGIHGKVIQVKNNKVVLRVSNNSEITVDTVAISRLSNLNKKESDGS
jgi:preprotein translocase subunit YajC